MWKHERLLASPPISPSSYLLEKAAALFQHTLLSSHQSPKGPSREPTWMSIQNNSQEPDSNEKTDFVF